MWEIAFCIVGAAAALAVALHLKKQLSGKGCESCPSRGSCRAKGCGKGNA